MNKQMQRDINTAQMYTAARTRRPYGINALVRDFGFTPEQAERFTVLVRRGKSVADAEREVFGAKGKP